MESQISRRDFLKICAATLGVSFVASETKKAVTGAIETPYANFYPFYEDHIKGIDLRTRNIPNPWDYHWQEGYFDPKESSIEEELSYRSQERTGLENFRILASRGTKMAFSDINAPLYHGGLSDITNKLRVTYEDKSEGITWDPKLHIWGSAIFFLRYQIKAIQALIKKTTGIDTTTYGNPYLENQMKRSDFIRKLIFIPLDLTTGNLFINTLTAGTWKHMPADAADLPVGINGEKIVHRSLNRAHGILTSLRPNDMVAFFRNLLWAEKLSDLAESESKRLNRKLNISYQVGMGHEGVEDMLELGRPFTSILLNMYSSKVWGDVIDKNNFDRVTTTKVLACSSKDTGDTLSSWASIENFQHRALIDILKSKNK